MMKLLAAMAVGMFLVANAQIATAADQQKSHEGTVVSAGNNKLEMKTDDGQDHSHMIDSSVQIMVHGKSGKLEDLQKGMRIRVTTDSDGKVTEVSTVDTK